jgi:eukaryotic-like serine/threonine-protein kinase
MTDGNEDNPPSAPGSPAGAQASPLLDQRYRILRLLGEGGMGAVYLAEHVGLGKQVAVKVLHAEFTNREDAIQRFRREAQVAASLRHKNIIEVFDVGVAAGGEPYLVMEYLEGESLRDLMARNRRIDLGAACAIIEPVLLALQAAHHKDIVHRDLKPDNVFLAFAPGEPLLVKLIDFGISKFANAGPNRWQTQTGQVLGTPNYMSPEQARGAANVDQRTDLYAVGTILYEMLTGGLPYAGDNFTEFFARLLTEEPRPPRAVYPDLPAEVEPFLHKAIHKDPAQRFQSAEEMLEALQALPAYARKSERVGMLGRSQALRTFAVGDLGAAALVANRDGGKATLAARQQATLPAAAGASTSPVADAHPGAPRWLLIAALVSAVVLVVGAVVLLLAAQRAATAPPPQPAAVPPKAAEPARAPEDTTPAPSPTATAPTAAEPTRSPAASRGATRSRGATAAKPREETTASEPSQSGIGNSLRALGADLIGKARSQVRRIPEGRSSQ